ncbi:MAG: extracellular solute-binding protein [Bifidobacteriaceae bacterium]|nr:extracellular solute-binding protein [Bifidobacteriaceae bacterium]
MRKHLRVLAPLAAIPLILTGCGDDGDGGTSTNSDGTDTQSTGEAIEFWTAWTDGADTEKASLPLIEQFIEDTGCEVNQTNFTYDMLHEKVIAAAAGQNLPDVAWGLPEYVAEFYKLGILADLSADWDTWADKDKVGESIKAAMEIDGKIIGFPYEATARAYLVHDDLLAEAGVEVPATWEEVLAVGSKVQDATGASFYGLTGTGVRSPQELVVYLAQAGVEIAVAQGDGLYRNTWNDNPDELAEAATVFKFYQDLMASGAVNANSATYGWEETDENFATALTASFVTGNWLSERESTNPEMGDVSVHPVPQPADGKPATYIEAKPLMVFNTSKNLSCATKLAIAFTSEEWQKAAFPARSALSTVSTDTKWSKDFSALLANGITFPPISMGEVSQNMIDSLARALQENEAPEATAAWLSDAVNKSLENAGELGTP